MNYAPTQLATVNKANNNKHNTKARQTRRSEEHTSELQSLV